MPFQLDISFTLQDSDGKPRHHILSKSSFELLSAVLKTYLLSFTHPSIFRKSNIFILAMIFRTNKPDHKINFQYELTQSKKLHMSFFLILIKWGLKNWTCLVLGGLNVIPKRTVLILNAIQNLRESFGFQMEKMVAKILWYLSPHLILVLRGSEIWPFEIGTFWRADFKWSGLLLSCPQNVTARIMTSLLCRFSRRLSEKKANAYYFNFILLPPLY